MKIHHYLLLILLWLILMGCKLDIDSDSDRIRLLSGEALDQLSGTWVFNSGYLGGYELYQGNDQLYPQFELKEDFSGTFSYLIFDDFNFNIVDEPYLFEFYKKEETIHYLDEPDRTFEYQLVLQFNNIEFSEVIISVHIEDESITFFSNDYNFMMDCVLFRV